jgi:tripartite-type tricarboxylate transporter receptor subunit TctC
MTGRNGYFHRLVGWIVCALVLAAFSIAPAQAQTYPSKRITLVVWTPAGTPLDVSMRRLANLLEKDLQQAVVVENRPGGNGVIAMAYLRSQPADGYTLLSTTSSMTIAMARGEVPFKVSDFLMLRMIEAEPSSIAVRKDSPFQNAADFVQRMKENPRGVKIGGFAAGGFHQYAYFQMQKALDFRASWIPFDGGRDAALAVLGGHLDVAFMTPSSALNQVENGDIRLLGIALDERSPYYPNVPTLKEQGLDISEAIWRGVMMKTGAPRPLVDRLQKAIDAALASEEWKKYRADNRQEARDLREGDMARAIERELEASRDFLKSAGFLK